MRVGTRRGLTAAAIAAPLLLLAAAWLVPPRLDLDGYRDTFAAIAARALGRPVAIGGTVHLSLLPEAVLTADDVRVADGAFTAQALRLRVAVLPLLAGRIAPRELVLRGPILHLPWPPPRPHLTAAAEPLAARIEAGTLTLGNVTLSGIAARIAVSETGAIAASGNATVAGRALQFGLKLTSAGTDGAAGLDLAVDAPALGGTFSGQIAADGAVAGDATLRTDDLSALVPAPNLPARAAGRVTISPLQAVADDLRIDLGGVPGHAAAALRLAPEARLDASLTLGRLDLDAWAAALAAVPARTPLPLALDLSAEAASLRGGTLRRLRVALDAGPDGLTLHEATAALPGEALLHLAGHAAAGGFDGTASLHGEAIGQTLAWLTGAGVAPFGPAPPDPPHALALAARAHWADGALALTGIDGTADGAPLSGSVAWRPGALAAQLSLARLDLAAFAPVLRAASDATDLDLHLARAVWGGVTFTDAALSVLALPDHIALRRFAGRMTEAGGGPQLVASGTLTAAGTLTEGRLDIAAADAAPLAAFLPRAWQATPAFWRGRLALAVRAEGPPDARTGRLALTVGDLQAEATGTADTAAGTFSGPIAIRHPGAPRLLEALGLLPPTAPAWLGDGSFALTGQFARAPGRLSLADFTLAAGALRAGGSLALDTAGPAPRLAGHLDADTLTLPLPRARSPDPLQFDRLRGWQAAVDISANTVLLGLSPALEGLSMHLDLAAGTLGIARLTARLAGGSLAASATIDAAADPPALTADATLEGAHVAGPLADLPIDLLSGTAAARLHLTAAGHGTAGLAATLSGTAALEVTNGALSGFDLPSLRAALLAATAAHDPAPEPALSAALRAGSTPFTRLSLAARIDHGAAAIGPARLEAGTGAVTATGTVGLTTADADLSLALQPALPDSHPPALGLRLTGPLAAPARIPELGAALRWLAGS
jgi:hypothetical protein